MVIRLLVTLIFFSFVITVILGIGLAVASVLHWVTPTIDYGTAVLCGLLAIWIFFYGVMQLSRFETARRYVFDEDSEEDSEIDEDEDILSEDQVESMANQIAERIARRISQESAMGDPGPRRRRH